MSPKAMRALYTGAIRPIFTCGSELWNRPGIEHELELMKRAEYQALRKITGAYHGSSHEKLLTIAHIEPLKTKLGDISVSWHDGRGAPTTHSRPHPIAETFYKTGIDRKEERSYGNRDDCTPTSLTVLTILELQDQRSKHQAYWTAGLSNLLDEGWRLCYRDGTGREGEVAAGVYSEDSRANNARCYGAYGGPTCSEADGERLALPPP